MNFTNSTDWGATFITGPWPISCRRPSSQAIRNDPKRTKTPQDLARLAAAQAKRERKRFKKGGA